MFASFSFQDLFYNPTNGGWIGTKLKNNRRQDKKKQKPTPDEINSDVETSDINVEEVVFELKNLNISKADTTEVRNMLNQTFDYRQRMINDNQNLDLLENFPYFFTNSDLVNIPIIFIHSKSS